jgi:DNA-binding LacI/PurR family transcriptional regulator
MQSQSTTKLPKHVTAEKALLRAIENGTYAPGAQLPGIRDLSIELGIAPMTLRQAIGRLSDQGILDRRQRVGTFVRSGRIFANIGVLFFHVRRISSSHLPSLTLQEIDQAASEKRRRVHAMLMTPPLPSATQVYEELRALNVGAVALQGFLDEDREFIGTLALHLPCVLFNKGITGLNLPCATPDGFSAGRQVVDYLVGRGRRRVACGRFVMGHRLHQEFLMTVEAELLRRELECDTSLWLQGVGHVQSEAETQAWIDRVLDPALKVDAVILGNTDMAQYAVSCLRNQGREPGRECDLVTLHGGSSPLAGPIPYARIAYHDPAAVEAGTRLLMDILEGRLAPDATPLVRIATELLPPTAYP